ncbi:putative Nudix hydrolase [Ktedonospora formicarum]|uniref:Putative Nudix hydrolase n=1 Tax=Ktedonospora formicarum TaxID=2778364 RepID=A0A8J3I0J3_9CHLR|nr:putative Nudix hydrolase [Ktedonospora formicarum]
MGTRSRAEVHTHGYWHETFHCWFFRREADKIYLLFQLRAASKKDYPLKLDITAAGHLLAGETPADGIREITEELGVVVNYDDLLPVDIIPVSFEMEGFIDREFCHIYLYHYQAPIPGFVLQEEEVADVVSVEINTLTALLSGEKPRINGLSCVRSFSSGQLITFDEHDLAPYTHTYITKLLQALRQYQI